MKTRCFLPVLVLIVLFASCRKDSDPAPPALPYVVAGTADGLYAPEMDPFLITVTAPLINGYKDIDINHDGVQDYRLIITCPFIDHTLNAWVGIESYDLNEVGTTYSNPTWIKSFHPGDSIDAGETWYACNVMFYQAPENDGYWLTSTERYAGVRTHVKDKVLYGWISVQLIPPDKLILKGFGSRQ